MSELRHENRISARTAPEILEGMNTLLARLKSAGYKFRNRKVGIEGLVGAAMLDFLARPPGEQRAILDARLPELESMLAKGGGPGGVTGVGEVADDEGPGNARRARKRG